MKMKNPHQTTNLLLVGSRALAFHLGSAYWRAPNDWDVWALLDDSDRKEYHVKLDNVEFSGFRHPGSSVDILEWALQDKTLSTTTSVPGVKGQEVVVAPVWLCYLLKLSHIHFLFKDKHRIDLKHLDEMDITLPSLKWSVLLEKRMIETIARLSKEQFFNDKVVRYIPHDSLHVYVSTAVRNSTPAYFSVVQNETEVVYDKFMYSIDANKRHQILSEEAIVLAMERDIIPALKDDKFNVWKWSLATKKPFIKWLERLASAGRINKNPVFISNYLQQNFESVKLQLEQDVNLLCNMPSAFWNFLL